MRPSSVACSYPPSCPCSDQQAGGCQNGWNVPPRSSPSKATNGSPNTNPPLQRIPENTTSPTAPTERRQPQRSTEVLLRKPRLQASGLSFTSGIPAQAGIHGGR